jgi:hypothetical protein
MRNSSLIVLGLVGSVALSFGVGQSAVSAAKLAKATCSKKNVGAISGGRVCTLRKRRYLWVTNPVTPAEVPLTTPVTEASVPLVPANPALATQRIKGPGGAWALDVPASWTINTKIRGQVTATDSQTGAELWLGIVPVRVKFAQVIADNPKLMKGEYGVNLVKSEPGSYAGSPMQTMWYSEPGSTKKIIVRQYEHELSVGGFLTAEITVKTEEAEAMLLESLDRMEVQWR